MPEDKENSEKILKMREALLKIENIACEAVENGTIDHSQYLRIVDVVETTLTDVDQGMSSNER